MDIITYTTYFWHFSWWDVCWTGKWCRGLREWTKVWSEESTGAGLNRGPLRRVELSVSFLHQLKDSRHVSFLLWGQRLRGRRQEVIKGLGSKGTLGWCAGHGNLSVECRLVTVVDRRRAVWSISSIVASFIAVGCLSLNSLSF
jgi:hypothetical protein